MSQIRSNIISVAKAEIGVQKDAQGRVKYAAWYAGGKFNGLAYCAMFVSWVYKNAGFPLPKIDDADGFRYCPTLYSKFKDRITLFPKPGDIVLYDWDGDKLSDHTGLFEGWDGSNHQYFFAIEGNTSAANNSNGGQVQRRRRHISTVRGFFNMIDDPGTTLRFGAVGEQVKILQRNLVSRGYHIGIDGDFGTETQEAVKHFQAENGLDTDGVVGPQTKKALAL